MYLQAGLRTRWVARLHRQLRPDENALLDHRSHLHLMMIRLSRCLHPSHSSILTKLEGPDMCNLDHPFYILDFMSSGYSVP